MTTQLDIEETRIYQDLERQIKLKAASRLLSMGCQSHASLTHDPYRHVCET